MMRPLVRELSLPLQTPMEVAIHKKTTREDENTHRKIEYSSGVVLLPSSSQSPQGQYAKIDYLFSYKGVDFACVLVFANVVAKDYLYVANTTSLRKTILPLQRLSRPLVYATANDSELWILSSVYM